jgi:hypothetical protein
MVVQDRYVSTNKDSKHRVIFRGGTVTIACVIDLSIEKSRKKKEWKIKIKGMSILIN